jgi:hypothetical protein
MCTSVLLGLLPIVLYRPCGCRLLNRGNLFFTMAMIDGVRLLSLRFGAECCRTIASFSNMGISFRTIFMNTSPVKNDCGYRRSSFTLVATYGMQSLLYYLISLV